MKSDSYNHFDKERLKISLLLANNTEINIHRSCVDRVPENYKRREYIIDKIYDPKKSVGKF